MEEKKKTGRKKGQGLGLPSAKPFPLAVRVREFYERVDKSGPRGCWIWTGGKISTGYGSFRFNNKPILAHRFSFFMRTGILPTRLQFICHHCDTPACVNPDHLFVGTPTDNVMDMIHKGRGVYRGNPKMSPDLVHKIRDEYATGKFTYDTLAVFFGVPRTQIFSALNKWKTLHLYAKTS